ncbi:MAG: hemolysin family protein [Pseudomonadota bacterium]
MILCLVITIFFFVVLEAFFSGSEMALVAANEKRMKLQADEGSVGAKRALRLLAKPEWLFSTTQVGVNICSVSNAVLSAALLLQILGPGSEWLAILILGPLLLFFGQLLPKNLFRQHATAMAPRIATPLAVARVLFFPLVALGALVSRRVQAWAGGKKYRSPFVTREEFLLLLGKEGGGPTVDLRAVEKQLILKMFSFRETAVREAMVPLVEVSAVPETATVSEVLEVFKSTPFSRLPVYRGRIDDIVGILHSFDLLGADPAESIARFRRPAQYVPEMKRVDELLVEMQRKRVRMCVVVDEYGGTVGIVTIEDLLEEILGEIRDEFEPETRRLVRLAEGHYLASARVEIDELNDKLGINLAKDGYETLGGLILERLGHVPRSGERFREGAVTVTVLAATDRAVREVDLLVSPARRPPSRFPDK